jgi:mono/diheme cytochrome c family protein
MKISTLSLIVLVSALSSCNLDKSKPNIELIQDMMESPTLKAQEYDETAPNGISARTPPQGTQPVGFTPYKYANDYDGAIKQVNPLAGQMSEEVLKVGMRHYETQCALCHGYKGEGGLEGNTIGELMSKKPPSMLSEKVRGWTDGQIYHVITMGQGLMNPYADHVPQKYRWQVVQYIRHLQKEAK